MARWFIETLEQRFWKHVQKTKTCWIWIGGKSGAGYGFIRVGKKGTPMIAAHRLSWQIHYGDIPAGKSVLHKCDNPPCVKPTDLFLGTLTDNSRDMISKGRDRYPFKVNPTLGELCHRAKVTESDVRKIRELYAKGGITTRELGEQFNMYHTGILAIIHRETWRHIA